METKARFIAQIITGHSTARQAEDIGGQELSYAEVKAIASGNPAVLTLAEADAELQRLSILKKNHADEQYLARQSLRTLPLNIHHLKERLISLTADMDSAAEQGEFSINVGNRKIAPDEVAGVLGTRLDALPKHVLEQKTFPLGKYQGLSFGIVLHPQFAPEAYLEGKATRQTRLSRDHHGPRAILNALEKLLAGYGSECERIRQDLAVAEKQVQEFQARLGATFGHEAYLTELTMQRDQLKTRLSGPAHDEDDKSLPSAIELAGRIKNLKAAHTVEAMPERVGKKRSVAEEPITARIRRRAEASNMLDAAEATAPPPLPETSPHARFFGTPTHDQPHGSEPGITR